MKHSSIQINPLCPACNISTQARGKNRSGTQKFACPHCGKYQTPKKKDSGRPLQKRLEHFWFERWILNGYTVAQIHQVTGFHPRWIQAELHRCLDQPTEILNSSFDKYFKTFPAQYRDFLIDGTWFGDLCCIALRCSQHQLIFSYTWAKQERASVIKRILRFCWYRPWIFRGFISDGGTGVVKAIEDSFPFKPHQHCLVHQMRRIMLCCGKRPTKDISKALKTVSLLIWDVRSHSDLKVWKTWLGEWVDVYRDDLKESYVDYLGRKKFLHQKARTGLVRLKTAVNHCFVFLDHEQMSRDSNAIEGGSFAPLKKKINLHSGMPSKRQQKLVEHYIALKNKEVLRKLNCYTSLNEKTV